MEDFGNKLAHRRNIKRNQWETDRRFESAFSQYVLSEGKFVNKKQKENLGGIPVGKNSLTENVCVDGSDVHSLIIGSTGSKKSRLVVMPMVKILGDAAETMIISDPKAEIYNKLSFFLKNKGYNIYVMNLRNPSSGNTWNPLAVPYMFYQKGDMDKVCEFINDIASNFVLAERNHADPFWDYSARDLFFGLALTLFKYCSEMGYPENFITIQNLLRLRRVMFKRDKESGISLKLWELVKEDDIISSSLIGTVQAPEKTQSSILCTFDEKMRIFTIQPNLVDMLSSNTISLEEIGRYKSAIFLIMPDEKTSYHRLVSAFVKQSYEYLIYLAQNIKEKRMKIRINYVLDEFSSLPQIKDFPAMITASRSRNIRFHLVIQSKNQLVNRYMEEAETIQANCMNWIFLTSREIALLEELSILCGEREQDRGRLMPVAALQHLNKENGEALVLSGRLYPHISVLPDIDCYIKTEYPILPIVERKLNIQAKVEYDFERYKCEVRKNFGSTKKIVNEQKELIDIQKELEEKFDELFGNNYENIE